jgi:DNA-binding transcriptional regulator YiaG
LLHVMAARVKAHVNPALIAWARETAGFSTPAEAAARLKIEEAQLAAWEDPTKEEKPSIPQLRKLAALFRRPLAVYMAEPPRKFAVMRDLRRLPGSPPLFARTSIGTTDSQRTQRVGARTRGGS